MRGNLPLDPFKPLALGLVDHQQTLHRDRPRFPCHSLHRKHRFQFLLQPFKYPRMSVSEPLFQQSLDRSPIIPFPLRSRTILTKCRPRWIDLGLPSPADHRAVIVFNSKRSEALRVFEPLTAESFERYRKITVGCSRARKWLAISIAHRYASGPSPSK